MHLSNILTFLGTFVLPQSQVQAHDQTNDIPLSTHKHWMHTATLALHHLTGTPCPIQAFGAAIVNHTIPQPSPLGTLICIGANDISSGNPTLHGEIAAINNCTDVLKDPSGPFRRTADEMQTVWRDLTLYTTAEPCPMCAAAIRWAGFSECVFGTEMGTLRGNGFQSVDMRTEEVFGRTSDWEVQTGLRGPVGEEETDPLFGWQFREGGECPEGCEKGEGGGCEVVKGEVKGEL